MMTGLRLLMGRWSLGVDILWWWLGGVVGFLFVFLDRMVYAFWQKPDETLSIKMKDLFAQGKILRGLALSLQERREQKNLMMRSIVFLFAWVVLGLFAVTSVVSPFGRGFMLGLGLHLAFDLMWDYVSRDRNVGMWFWQIKREFSETEKKVVTWGFVVIFGFLAWWL